VPTAELQKTSVETPMKSAVNFLARYWIVVAIAMTGLAFPSGRANAQVVVMVNGVPITALDIEKRMKLVEVSTHKKASRQQIVQELIDDQVKISAAKPYSLEVNKKEVDQAFETMAKRMGMSADLFAQNITRSGVSVDALKARLRADLTWNQLVRGRFQSSLTVADSDVSLAMRSRGENPNTAIGYLYKIYPIMVIAPSGSSGATIEAKRKEAEALRARFRDCKEGIPMARVTRDVAVRAPIMRSSADLPEKLRQLLDSMQVGQMTSPEQVAQGLQMFALCQKTQSTEDAPVRSEVRQEIYGKRFEEESKRFLDEARKSAMIEYKNK
jgi:peptidyl-prolyl cis-trans isomerase SurA